MGSRARLAVGASVVSFVFVALVATTPGSPFSPVLPSTPSGPVTALAELVGLDALHGSAIAAVGVVGVALAAAAFAFVLLECWRGSIASRTVTSVLAGSGHANWIPGRRPTRNRRARCCGTPNS